MQTITITSEKDRRYTASAEGKPFAKLYYPKWHSQDAEIEVGGSTYFIKGVGFWKTSSEVLRDGKVLYEIKNTWRGTIISRAKELHHFYRLKPKAWLKSGYILETYRGEGIMEIKTDYSWKSFYSGYTVNCDDKNSGKDGLLLALIATHCYRATQKQNAAIGAAT
ncbi:hypothetical protein [uncultured Flavobacterium sp.]|uniref:hypothetical protein n=1 Tax=uncultured Flavobacterium sp. TaxID=165435 RepID=UPI0025D33F3E|nr:hypothetical protein [uncultured Flavobacterium sp.]